MKSKGFTLIELLAVIVILAIIALIATPIVLNIIKDSKESAQLRSAEFYLDGVEYSITKKIMDNPTFKPTSCVVQSDGNLKCDGIDVKVEVSGEMPNSGEICISGKGIVDKVMVKYDNYYISHDEKEIKISDKETFDSFSCSSNGGPEVQLQSGLYDEEGNLIVSWDKLVNDHGIVLDKDYMDENGQPIVDDLTKLPGVLLSQGELSQGTKLVIDSSVETIGSAAFAANTSLRGIIIPNSVTSIGVQAFAQCTNLKEITIPNSVTSIGLAAFVQCTNLEEIIIPNSIKSIGEGTFRSCTGLESITIPDGVTSIGDLLFFDCTSLTDVTLPNSVTSIGDSAFSGCTSLNTINYTGTQNQWSSISRPSNWDYNTPANKIINYNYVITQN